MKVYIDLVQPAWRDESVWLTEYLLTPCSRVLLEKLAGSQLVKKLPAFYRTRRFITALTSVRQLSLPWTRSIQSKFPFYFLKICFKIILPSTSTSSHCTFSQRPPHKTLYAPLLSPIRATCLVSTGLFEMIVRVLTTCHTQYTWDSSVCTFYLIEQHSQFLLHTLQVLYMCTLCDSTNINTIIQFVPNCL